MQKNKKYMKHLKSFKIFESASTEIDVKLNREVVEGMIETYEFLSSQNEGVDAEVTEKIKVALETALLQTPKFVTIKLDRKIVEGMIGTYEFLLFQNKGSDDAKVTEKILNALKKSLK